MDRSTWRGAAHPQSIADDSRQTDESRRLQRTRAASLGEPLEFLPHRIHQFKANKKCLFDTTKLRRRMHLRSCREPEHPDAGRDWGQEEKGMTEDEMAGWHH